MNAYRPGRVSSWMRIFLCVCLWAIPIGYLVYSLVIIQFVADHSYEAILQFYSRNWPDAFDLESVSRNCFTQGWYGWIRGHNRVLTVLNSFVLTAYVLYSRAVMRFMRGLLQETGRVLHFLGKSFAGCNPGEKKALSVLFGGLLIYWVYTFVNSPMFLDEGCSYFNFVRQGVLFTIINYPVPNNHIFFNIICSVLYKISFLSPELVMRLPSMATSFLLYYGIFCIFKYWGGFQRAIVVVAGVAFCHILSYYTVQGRGYQVQLLFVVVSALSGWAYFFSPLWSGRAGYFLFVVSSVLGFYVNPLFVYHFLSLLLLFGYLVIKGREFSKGWLFLRAVFLIGGVTLILYLPLILGSSWRALTDNQYISEGRPLHALIDQFGILVYDLKYIFYYGSGSLVLLAVAIPGALFLYFRGKLKGAFYDYAFYYFVASLLALAMVTIYKRIYPLERGLCFWVLALNIMFVNVCYDVIRAYFPRRAWVLIIFLIGLKIAGSLRLLYMDRFAIRNYIDVQVYNEPQKIYEQLCKLRPGSWQVMDSEDSYPVYLKLYLLEHGKGGRVLFNRKEAVGDVIFLPDSCTLSVPLQRYTRWADKEGHTDFDGGKLHIYVARNFLTLTGNQ